VKATLEFNLDDFLDRKAHKRAISATDAYILLFDLDQYLRNKLKYTELGIEGEAILLEVREKLTELQTQYSIYTEDLE
jgi:hypothetical protein